MRSRDLRMIMRDMTDTILLRSAWEMAASRSPSA
jgi:hypothetical protein